MDSVRKSCDIERTNGHDDNDGNVFDNDGDDGRDDGE